MYLSIPPYLHIIIIYYSSLTGCFRVVLSRSLTGVFFFFFFFFFFAPEFHCCYFCESSCMFYLSLNSDFEVSKIMHLRVRNLPRKPNN